MAERKPYAKVPLHRDANRLGPQEHDAGASFVDLGRRHGAHPNTIANWQSKYGGMESSELARARAVEDENVRMRRIIANLARERRDETVDRKTPGALLAKKRGEGPQELGLSQRAACRITGCARSVAQYRIRRSDDPHMVERLKAIALERRRFGYRRLGLMLRREGIVANHKRVYRMYRDLALQLRPRRKRGVRYVRGNDVPVVTTPNERWSIDFVHDRLSTGRAFRPNRCRRFLARVRCT
jgi:putative transposase